MMDLMTIMLVVLVVNALALVFLQRRMCRQLESEARNWMRRAENAERELARRD